MPIINRRFYSAFGHYSPYVSSIIQRYRMREANNRVVASLDAFTTGLSSAAINQVQGLANIAAQRALDRSNAETKAKQAENSQGNNDIVIDAPKNSVFSVDSSTTLSGGSQVNLDSNTLTLPDVAVIDLTTCLKKVDVVV